MTDPANELANRARRRAVVLVLRAHRFMSLTQLCVLVEGGLYASVLGTTTIADLRGRQPPRVAVPRSKPLDREAIAAAMLRWFRREPTRRFTSRFFRDELGLQRWDATRILGDLVARGLVVRTGTTSATRYRLADDDASALDDGSGGGTP